MALGQAPVTAARSVGQLSWLGRLPWYYGWTIVAASCAALAIAMGARAIVGVILAALFEAFDWGRAATAGALSISFVVSMLTAPWWGTLLDRWGGVADLPVRRVGAGAEELGERERLVGVGELEPLLVVVPGVAEQPRVFLERDEPDDVGGVLRGVPRGPEAVQKRPADLAGRRGVLADQRLGQRRLARPDRPDDGPGLALADRPRQLTKHDGTAGV